MYTLKKFQDDFKMVSKKFILLKTNTDRYTVDIFLHSSPPQFFFFHIFFKV